MERENPRALANEILHMAELDQAMRAEFIEQRSEWDDSIDQINTARLKQLVDEYGWPTIPKVGAEASHAAWLIAQHSPDLEFMVDCLCLIKNVPKGEIDPANEAYLEDRVLTLIGEPQIYGTQFHGEDEDFAAFPTRNQDALDRRRESVGLNSYAENETALRKLYTNPD